MESTLTLYTDQLGKDEGSNYFDIIKRLRVAVGTVKRSGYTTYYVKGNEFNLGIQIPKFLKDKRPYQI